MAGRLGGIGGFEADHFVAGLVGRDAADLPPYGMAAGPMIFDAVLMSVDDGRCQELARVGDRMCRQWISACRSPRPSR